MKQGEIRSLTGLRGVAAIIVMAYHFQAVPGVALWGVPPLGPGYLMVDLFFVLSGFVMARTYGDAFSNGMSWPRFAGFLEARIARVYPLYAFVCVSVFLLTKFHITVSAPYPVRALVANILMIENLGAAWIAPGFAEYLDPPSWSISTELGAYLLFPALAAVALHRSRSIAIGLVLICAGTVLGLSIMPHTWRHTPFSNDPLNISSGETLWPLARCLAEFTTGLLSYRLSLHFKFKRRLRSADFLIGAAIISAWLVPGTDVLIVALFPLLIIQVCEDDTPFAWLLASRVPYKLGEWSYAIYLVHWPSLGLLKFFQPLFQHFGILHAHEASLAVITVLVVTGSLTAHNVIEKPARALLRNLFQQSPRSTQLEPSA